jgi:hypothetical protein
MNFTSAKQNACLLLLATLCLSACEAPAGQEWKPTIGLSTAVSAGYELETEATGPSLNGLLYFFDVLDGDLSMTEIELGQTLVTADYERTIKHQFYGIKIGSGEASTSGGTLSADLDEFSVGGIFYFDKGTDLVPFCSIFTTASKLDIDELGIEPSILGIRLGGGFEFSINKSAVITLGADYLIPLRSGEVIYAGDGLGFGEDVTPLAFELSGLAVRLGIRFVL